MNFTGNISSIRGGSVSADFSVGRGQQLGAPKKSFGAKTPPAPSGEAERARLRSQLDTLHAQIRATPNVARLSDLVDDYLLVLAALAETPATPIPIVSGPLPAARILSAVIAALRKERAAAAATGNVGPVVSGDNIAAPRHSLA